jgi:hypothetical protein
MSPDLSDEQWCLLDLLHHASEKGSPVIHRSELLQSADIPQMAAVKLTWAALTMPDGLVQWTGKDTFKATERGLAAFRFRFGRKPSPVADAVICLPDLRSVQ